MLGLERFLSLSVVKHKQSNIAAKNSMICKSMIPHIGKTLFSSVPQATPSSQSQTLEGLLRLYDLTLQGPSTRPCGLLLELQRYMDTIRCVPYNAFVINPLVFVVSKIGLAPGPLCPIPSCSKKVTTLQIPV